MVRAKERVLVVEDEDAILLGLEENLNYAGYDVLTANDGPSGLDLALKKHPHLIILDLMLPGMSGFEVCRQLRDQGIQTPIIMLTARGDEFDRVHGFEVGADDYVTKPFSVDELLLRIKAVLRRGGSPFAESKTYTFGDCRLDAESRVLWKKDREIALTHTEFDLLLYFCRNEGKALSRDVVMNDVWGTEYYGTQRSLDSFVASLRSKIEVKTSAPRHILTVHGVGYKFVTG